MGQDLLAISEEILNGEREIGDTGIMPAFGTEIAEICDGVGYVPSFSNVMPFKTGDGIVLVDTSSPLTEKAAHAEVRKWTGERLHTAIYTHGHLDHVSGVGTYEAEAAANGWPAPRVLAHEAIVERFDRYKLTRGYNSIINARQFRIAGLEFPSEFRYPDTTYDESFDLDAGDKTFKLVHSRGETDDHTWVFEPDSRALCPGDLMIWCLPNAGNPQKSQRYAHDWARALRAMAALDPEYLLPSHGLPIAGAARVREVLEDTAAVLESLLEQTIEMMNAGATLDEIIHTVRAPAGLLDKPYLAPTYDEPEFVVRGIWRYYGGWYDQNPANLKPAPFATLSREIAGLCGGPERLAKRASELADSGDLRLAAHLVEFAATANPDDSAVHGTRAEIYRRRVHEESSLMAKSIFGAAAHDSKQRSDGA